MAIVTNVELVMAKIHMLFVLSLYSPEDVVCGSTRWLFVAR
jgi:hypothetical protein